MRLKDNPFYILRLPCSAGRARINEAMEEQAFFLDESLSTEAGNILLNPSRRLAAELDWFLELDAEQLQPILESLDAGEAVRSGFSGPLFKINTAVEYFENIPGCGDGDIRMLERNILSLSAECEKLSMSELCSLIDCRRREAGFPVPAADEVSRAWNEKLRDMASAVEKPLSGLSGNGYMKLFTSLSRQFSGVEPPLMTKLLDGYELHIAPERDALEKYLLDIAEKADKGSLPSKNEIPLITSRIKNWGRHVRPLMPRQINISSDFKGGIKILNATRSLAADLFNKGSRSEDSLSILDTLLSIYDLPCEGRKFIESDREKIAEGGKLKEIAEGISALNDACEEFGRSARSADRLIYALQKAHSAVKESDMDFDTRKKTLEFIFVITVKAAADAFTDMKNYSQARRVLEALKPMYSGDFEKTTLLDTILAKIPRSYVTGNYAPSSNDSDGSTARILLGMLALLFFFMIGSCGG